MPIYENIIATVGHTPLIRLNPIAESLPTYRQLLATGPICNWADQLAPIPLPAARIQGAARRQLPTKPRNAAPEDGFLAGWSLDLAV